MILLHVLKFLDDEGHGTIDTDLFWEHMPLDKDGVTIFSRGGVITHRNSKVNQAFDLYSRHQHNTYAADRLEKIWETFTEKYPTCTLPSVPGYSNKTYENTVIEPTTNVENLGFDEQGKTVFRLSGEVIYRKG